MSSNNQNTQEITLPDGFATKSPIIKKKVKKPEPDLSMIRGDTDEIDDVVKNLEKDLIFAQVKSITPHHQQLLDMLKNPPPAEMLIKMLLDLFQTEMRPDGDMVIGYDANEGQFSYKTENEWKMEKIKDAVENGDHDDAIRDWVMRYICANDELPGGLDLDEH
jgi:hypothetical protein